MKQKSRFANISRVYNFENAQNGGLGPGFFINKFVNKIINTNKFINIVKDKIFDLSIHIILNNNNQNNLEEIINNINKNYTFNIQKYLKNNTNMDAIKNNIQRDNNIKLIIVDSLISQDFINLTIPYIVYDINNTNINNNIINTINSILFYKIENKLKI
jgi:hypothetical protein